MKELLSSKPANYLPKNLNSGQAEIYATRITTKCQHDAAGVRHVENLKNETTISPKEKKRELSEKNTTNSMSTVFCFLFVLCSVFCVVCCAVSVIGSKDPPVHNLFSCVNPMFDCNTLLINIELFLPFDFN